MVTDEEYLYFVDRALDGMATILGRHTTPDEIAQAALYLASDASAMVTAATFKVDGGMSG